MPELVGDGFLVAGDAAAMCLAAGIWLEGVNFALGAGMCAGRAAVAALTADDTSKAGLSSYRRMLDESFVLGDHRKLRRVPGLVLGQRMQESYPAMLCDLAQGLFHVDNPRPKPGLLKLVRRTLKRHGIRARDLVSDALTGVRSFG
jgi:electron transfer flavoprotein-quinone oxidoreductase